MQASPRLRQEFERLLQEWQQPQLSSSLNPLDALFAYRLLLARNPDRGRELSNLLHLSQTVTLREFLNSVVASTEFAAQPGFLPPDRLLMSELPQFRFWFNTSDREMGVKMGFGTYEPETVAFFTRTLKLGMTCWDIGAQSGFFTCLFAFLIGPTGKVFAFEPLRSSYAILMRNVAENNFGDRVTASNVACSDETGFIPMTLGANMYVVDRSSANATQVECVRLDQQEATLPDLIKIDVEGHEPAVLRGLKGVFEKCDPIVVLELNEYWLKRNSQSSGASVLRYLHEHGFKTYDMGARNTPLRWEKFSQGELSNCNVIALRGSVSGKIPS